MRKHEEALEKSLHCFHSLKLLFNAISKVFDVIVMIGPENLKNCNFTSLKTLKNLIKYVEYVKKVALPDENQNFKWEPEANDWKFNKDNYEKFLVKEIRSNANFDFLVDKIKLTWIENFQPSHVFVVKDLKDFLFTLKNVSFGEDFVVKAILVFSSCVFSIAAENRFISHSFTKRKGWN